MKKKNILVINKIQKTTQIWKKKHNQIQHNLKKKNTIKYNLNTSAIDNAHT